MLSDPYNCVTFLGDLSSLFRAPPFDHGFPDRSRVGPHRGADLPRDLDARLLGDELGEDHGRVAADLSVLHCARFPRDVFHGLDRDSRINCGV